jgi:hypothetical protein
MIYTFPEPTSPIRQGDIFINVPILALPDDELPVIDDTDTPRTITWEEFATASESVSALIAVRPTIAVVGTQECDAVRAPNITLFEVRPFREIERKSKDTTKPAKWVPILTQHARINQKWFYLPSDEAIGFSEKMGADFLTPISIPRLALERLINFRKGRLNEVASQHFRERLADFFRRYAYDEWYPLTREELTEYQKNHPDAAPFSWQAETPIPDEKGKDEKATVAEISEEDNEKRKSGYLLEAMNAIREFIALNNPLGTKLDNITDQLDSFLSNHDEFDNKLEEIEEEEYKIIVLTCTAEMNNFYKAMKTLLPIHDKNIQTLEESLIMYISLANPDSNKDVMQISTFRAAMPILPGLLREGNKALRQLRDDALIISTMAINQGLKEAASQQSQILNLIIYNMEAAESLFLKVAFLIDEKFGKLPISEDKTD